MKMYIAVLDAVPDHITPTLVAHAVLGAHLVHSGNENYDHWLKNSFKKCVLRVNRKEFDKIAALPGVYLGHESTTLGGGDQELCHPHPVHQRGPTQRAQVR